MPSNITQFHLQNRGYERGAGDRVRAATRHVLATAVAGAFIALGTLFTAQSADAGGYTQRYQVVPSGYAYNTQANPNYGFGPVVRVHPHDVISGDRIVGRDPDPFIRGEILRHYNSRSN